MHSECTLKYILKEHNQILKKLEILLKYLSCWQQLSLEVIHMLLSRGATLLVISSLLELAVWSVTSVWGLVT